MTIKQIESQWLKINADIVESGFHSIRISAECIPDLFLGIDEGGLRSLILSIPQHHEFQFRGINKQNLSIDFFKESNHIILKLANSSFIDLFNDLILSLYNKVFCINDIDTYSKEFIQAFYRWNGFFTDITGLGLSEDVIKGIFGELLLLKHLVQQSDSLTINEMLASWKGPYDAVNDFEFDKSVTEVKTKDDSKTHITISSEFQLATKPDKPLSLCIVSVVVDLVDGLSIEDIIMSIKELTWERLGDVTIFINALAKKGLLTHNLSLYNSFKFLPVNMTFYDCENALFPKIVPENLTTGIFGVFYNLRVSELKEFKVSEKML